MKQHKFWLVFLVLILLFPVNFSYAWNSFGHKVIAQIAYENLTSEALSMVSQMNKGIKGVYAQRTFVNAGPWLDKLRYKNKLLRKLHYINLPYSPDNSRVPEPSIPNAVTAISYATKILSSDSATKYEKSFNFRVLLHVVGDIHQPLHAASLYSRSFPKGDRGGNLITLAPNPIANTLHSYWDNGGGLLKAKRKVTLKIVRQKAKAIMEVYPCNNSVEILEPSAWAKESHKIALKSAYSFKPNTRPTEAYQKQVKLLSEQRIALAGCRLAKVLNQIAVVP